MSKLQIIRRVKDGEAIPSNWWGLCWFEDYERVKVIAPIPLNLLVTIARRWHEKLQFLWVNKLLRGAQISRRQHSLALRKVNNIIAELLERDRIDADQTGKETVLETYHHPDLPLYVYLAEVLNRDLRRAPRNVR